MRPAADSDLTRDGAALHPGAALSILPAPRPRRRAHTQLANHVQRRNASGPDRACAE